VPMHCTGTRKIQAMSILLAMSSWFRCLREVQIAIFVFWCIQGHVLPILHLTAQECGHGLEVSFL
jgi:hypothetical protein